MAQGNKEIIDKAMKVIQSHQEVTNLLNDLKNDIEKDQSQPAQATTMPTPAPAPSTPAAA